MSKHRESKINQVALKIIPCQENTTPQNCIIEDNISLIAICFYFSQTNLVFILLLTYWIVFVTVIYILTFWLSIFYGFWSSPSASTPFLWKSVKFRWDSMFFSKVFSIKMFLLYVLFSMKHFSLLSVKLTRNNCLTLIIRLTWKVSKYGVIFGPYFPVFGLNTEIYSVNVRIHSEYRNIRTRNYSVFGHFSRSERN